MKFLTGKLSAIQIVNALGNQIEVKGLKKAIIHMPDGKQVWCPLDAVKEGMNMVTYKLHEKGDVFTATRDSSRVNPEGHKNAGNPLYLKGGKVTRDAESIEFIALTKEDVFTQATKDKMAYAKELGLAVTI